MTRTSSWRRSLFILAILVVALFLRHRAVTRLPIDYDEDDYLLAAQHYAAALRAGDWAEISDWDYLYEHPPLPRLIYGAALLALPPAPPIPQRPTSAPPASDLPQPHLFVARAVAGGLGLLEVLALALVSPLAGLLLAIHSWQIKYTSQVMLEAWPALASLVAVLAYSRSLASPRRAGAWQALSGVALGLAAAGKYLYAVAGLAILIDWVLRLYRGPASEAGARRSARPRLAAVAPVLAWGGLALLTFYAADPFLWPDPVGRLIRSLTYHRNYATGAAEVERANHPMWQPLVWLSGPVPWHPGVILISLDLFITVLAGVGLRRLWREQRVYALWLGVALGFLLIWPTKWPQYILVLTAPLCLAAAHGLRQAVLEPLAEWRAARPALRARPVATTLAEQARARRFGWAELRRAGPWLVPGLVVLVPIAVFPLVYQAAMALTDFSALSIRDGIQGGVWREVWRGLTGQVEAVPVTLMGRGASPGLQVRYAGLGMLRELFTGLASDGLFFNVMWAGLSVALQGAIGVAAAWALSRPGLRGARWWRAIFILPWAIPEFVGALMWLLLVHPEQGTLQSAVPVSGSFPPLLSNPNTALLVLLVAAAWYGFPMVMLAASAGLKLVPDEAYDAAALDGAFGWRLFRHVAWPMLLPLVAPALLIRGIFAFNQFYLFWVTPVQYPVTTFSTMSYFFFSNFGGGRYAVSAAINVFTVVVLVALIWAFNRASRAGAGVTYA